MSLKKYVILNLNQWIKIPSFKDMHDVKLFEVALLWFTLESYMFISLKISKTSAYRVEYTLTSINKDLQTSIRMLPKKWTRLGIHTSKL